MDTVRTFARRIKKIAVSNAAKRAMMLIIPMIALAFCQQAKAQGYYEFLGDAQQVPDQYSPKYGIRYNTQGFDNPTVRNVNRMERKGAPDYDVQAVETFPGSADAFSTWIDDAFDETMREFTKCGGALADRARQVSPANVSVTIEPTAFFVPALGYACAGVYLPDQHQIHVLNIYYTWSGPNKGWLRNAKDLIKWEMENYFAVETGIQAEPRTPDWPCDAPAQ